MCYNVTMDRHTGKMRRSLNREKSSNTMSSLGAEDDEIEYNLTFPRCSNEAKEPVVYLLGWWGVTDKILAKYSQIYEDIGCITIRYIFQKTAFDVVNKMSDDVSKAYGEKLFQLLEDYDLSSNPILIHSFSNSGAAIYHGLISHLIQNKSNVIGTVFDSGPAKTDIRILWKALYASMNTNLLLYLLAAAGVTLHAGFILLKESLGIGGMLNVFSSIANNPDSTWPSLLLYSTADGVCPENNVLELKTRREKAGSVFVRIFNFVTSGHTQHLIHHKEVYERLCTEFIEDCLAIYDGENVDNIIKEREYFYKESSVDFPEASQQHGTRPKSYL